MHGLILFYVIDKTEPIWDAAFCFVERIIMQKAENKIFASYVLYNFPWVIIRSWKLFLSRWVIRTEHSSIIAPATAIVSISTINNERFSSRQMIVKLK